MHPKPKWILLRGLCREKGHWSGFIETFQSQFPDHEMVPLDLPGTGDYRDMKCPLSISQMTDFLRSEVQRKNLFGAPISLLAISLGGMLALDWMARYPNDLVSSVLINSSVGDLCPFYKRLRWQIYKPFFSASIMADPFLRELNLLQILSNREETRESTAREWGQLFEQRPVRKTNALRQLIAAQRFRSPNAPIRTPLLLLASKKDRLVDSSCSESIHRRWHSQLLFHPWGGHDLTLDDGPWVAETVRNWLSQRVGTESILSPSDLGR